MIGSSVSAIIMRRRTNPDAGNASRVGSARPCRKSLVAVVIVSRVPELKKRSVGKLGELAPGNRGEYSL
jgi:hypothetical protein